jgi:hypothetical protein
MRGKMSAPWHGYSPDGRWPEVRLISGKVVGATRFLVAPLRGG